MPFWTTYTTDPKRSFRYLFIIPGAGNNLLRTYTIKDVKKPTFQMEAGPQAKYIQHTFKYPGRVQWQDVTFSVIDPGAQDSEASVALMNILAESGYEVPTGDNAAAKRSISKEKAVGAGIGTPKIQEINAEGRATTTWTLHNTYISSVDFGNLSYDTDELVTYQVTLVYDYATINSTLGVEVKDGIRSRSS